MNVIIKKMAKFGSSDYSNMHTCLSYATVSMKAEDLPALGSLITNIAKASRGECELTQAECDSVVDCITLALQSQKLVPSRQFDAPTCATLGELVTKLKGTAEVKPETTQV